MFWLKSVALAALFASATCLAAPTFNANELQFKAIFAQRSDDKTVYCLLGIGFFVTLRSDDVDNQIDQWLSAHPNAKVTVVDTTQTGGKLGTMDYVWIESGADNLNVALVRNGAFPGGVMIDPVEYFNRLHGMGGTESDEHAPKRLVTTARYQAFRARVIDAERMAKKQKKGIWADRYRELRDEQGVR